MKTVIIPAAGRGSRFSPYTHIVPKELLPLLNQPALFYTLQECKTMQNLVLISRPEKKIVEDYVHQQLHHSHITLNCIYQKEPRGLGDAILQAHSAVHSDFFGVLLPDDIITLPYSLIDHLQQLSELYQASIIAVQEVLPSEVSNYGIVQIDSSIQENLYHIASIVEKPSVKQAPSTLAVVGRYWLSHDIFSYIDTNIMHGEIQLTSALQRLLENNHPILAYKIPAYCRHDIGTPPGWLKATLHFAAQNPHLLALLEQSSYLRSQQL
jgi:UTP--glucose-1-phosphate uridylyltransferase